MFDPQRLGRSLRAIRVRLELRQADVAQRAAVSRSFVSNLERGLARSTDIAMIERVCRAVGADLDVRIRWRGEGLDRLLDEGHAALVDRMVRLLTAFGWAKWLEVTFNSYGDRGSIDLLGWHGQTRSLLIVEVKSVVADAQGTLSPLDRKARVGPGLGRERGLDAATISRLLVVGDHSANRRRVARFDSLFGAALPVRGRALRHWLQAPQGAVAGLLFLSDVTAGGARRTTAGRCRVNPGRKRRHGVE